VLLRDAHAVETIESFQGDTFADILVRVRVRVSSSLLSGSTDFEISECGGSSTGRLPRAMDNRDR
jgi:hypothetical protein